MAIMTMNELTTAVDAASNGDTLTVGEATFTFASEYAIYKNLTIIGAGIGKTIFKSAGGSSAGIIEFSGQSVLYPIRISGISFQHDTKGMRCIALYNSMLNFRVDNCRFGDAVRGVYVGTAAYGLVDHCTAFNYTIGVDVTRVIDETAWDLNESLGIGHEVYVEDCTFDGDDIVNYILCAVYGIYSARTVVRHNTIRSTFDGALLTVAGKLDANKGNYSIEIYNNTFTADTVNQAYFMYLRGGKGVVYNNTFIATGSVDTPICLGNKESFNPNDITDRTSAAILCKTYPAPYQINNFYLWNNTLNGAGLSDNVPKPYVQDRGLERDHIQLNRDYFDTAMPGYTPLVYPHPLAQETQGFTIDRSSSFISRKSAFTIL
jgi:hypothetical protein